MCPLPICTTHAHTHTICTRLKGMNYKSHVKTKIMASGPITSWEIDGETVADFIFGAPKSLQMVTAAMKLKDSCSLEGKL